MHHNLVTQTKVHHLCAENWKYVSLFHAKHLKYLQFVVLQKEYTVRIHNCCWTAGLFALDQCKHFNLCKLDFVHDCILECFRVQQKCFLNFQCCCRGLLMKASNDSLLLQSVSTFSSTILSWQRNGSTKRHAYNFIAATWSGHLMETLSPPWLMRFGTSRNILNASTQSSCVN